MVTRFDWTNSGTYRVFAEPDESPLHGESGSDLDLYLDGESCDFFGCVWNELANSTSVNCAESISGMPPELKSAA